MRRLVISGFLFLVCVSNSLFAQSTYNIYYGDNHSHTWYSDGNQDKTNPSVTYPLPVAQGITWARNNRSSFDFLGISDHNHVDGGYPMSLPLWRSGMHEADSANQDGNFIGMYGQEWGVISGGGHVLIYGTDKLFGWNPGVYDVYVPKSNYAYLWDSVRKYNGFCILAHPNSTDFGGIFSNPYNASYDSVIQGIAMKSGPATSTNTTETNPSTSDYSTLYHSILRRGYHVAPYGHQDNHNTTYGRVNQQRTAVLATSLTRANIIDAMRNRRVYTTEDHNLQVRFEVGAHQIGEQFSMSGSIPLKVRAYDPDGGESISKIELRYGVPGSGTDPTVLTSVLNQDSLVFSQTQTVGTTCYYYAYIQEADGNEAWTAPMWITATAGSPPGSFSLLTPSNGIANQTIGGTLTWQSSTGATSYDVYLGTSNPPTTKVSADQAGTSYNYSSLSSGTTYYWKVVAKNASGSTDAATSPWSFSTVQAAPIPFNLLTPGNSSSNVPVNGALSWQASTNATGYDVYLGTVNPPVSKVSSNQPGTSYSYTGLSNSAAYYWKVVARNSVDSTVATGSPWNFTTIISVPGSFALLSPADNSVDQPASATLSWQASAGAASYDVYLGTTNPPTTKVSSDQLGTTYNYSGLTNSSVYYWKVVAKNAGGSTGATATPWKFTTIIAPPGSFSLISPAPGAINQAVGGTLTWQSSVNASSYDVYLDANYPPAIKVSSDQSGTTYDYTGLSNNTTYYWKIISKNISGISESASRSFTTIISPPGAFSLISPAVGAINQPVSGVLSWQASANSVTYDVYLDTANSPAVKISADQAGTSFSYAGLLNSTIYYWKVVSKNVNGSIQATGSPSDFTTLIAGPGAFSLSSPANNLLDQSVSGSLEWQPSSNASAYDLYLDVTNPPLNKVSSNQAGTTYNFSSLAFHTVYYWKVVARNIADSIIAAGSPWKFTTVVSAPSAFQLLSPADGAVEQSLTGTLSWQSSFNASSYDIYLDVHNPPVVKVDSNISGVVLNYFNLQGGSTYYWKVVARNISGIIEASNSPRQFSTVNVPAAPSNVTSSNITEISLSISWTDNASNELGYRVYRASVIEGPYAKINGDLPANSTNFNDTDLEANHRYYYRILSFNNGGEGSYAEILLTTLASVPNSLSLSDISYQSMKVVVNPGNNPASTQFAVKSVVNDTDRYVYPNGSLGATAQWQSYSEWGGSNGIMVNGLVPCRIYSFSSEAKNADNIETQFSIPSVAQALCNIIMNNVTEGWNIVSVPVEAPDARVLSLFPAAVSQAFSFNTSYVAKETLSVGSGYWIKFNNSQILSLVGDPVTSDTILINAGWNIVGSLSVPVSVTSVISQPDGIITSDYFGYAGMYIREDSLQPMRGYWVKANAPGKLILNSSPVLSKNVNRFQPDISADEEVSLSFEDGFGHTKKLHLIKGPDFSAAKIDRALPPVPPGDGFDVRFSSQSDVVYYSSGGMNSFPIRIQASGCPVKFSWDNKITGAEVSLHLGNSTIDISSQGSMMIDSKDVRFAIVVKHSSANQKDFSLSDNYPNPFNPSTIIKYKVPSTEYVSMKVYDVLGQIVATLVDDVKGPGNYTVQWDASASGGLPGGVYFYRLSTGKFTDLKKMILVK